MDEDDEDDNDSVTVEVNELEPGINSIAINSISIELSA